MKKIRLGVNIDHVATLRNARGGLHPNPITVAKEAINFGADSITIHLREDRRHINDIDLKKLSKIKIPLNLEIACNYKMMKIALKNNPKFVCLVPERRMEVTTEGGLNLKKNFKINFTIDRSKNNSLITLNFPVSKKKTILISRNLDNGKFNSDEIVRNLNKRIVLKEGKITQSLYKSAVNQKIQPNIIIDFARIYGFQIDFQRDIRKNDTFQIMYEVFQDDEEKIFDTGKILYANMTLRGQKNELYYFNKKK